MNTETNSPALHEIQRKILRINRLQRSAVNTKFSDCGLHRSRHRILMHLSHASASINQKDLALRFEVSPAAITSSLKRLEADGYIIRTPNKFDTRENFITITEKGSTVIEYSRTAFDEIDESAYGSLSSEELISLNNILEKVIKNLEGTKL